MKVFKNQTKKAKTTKKNFHYLYKERVLILAALLTLVSAFLAGNVFYLKQNNTRLKKELSIISKKQPTEKKGLDSALILLYRTLEKDDSEAWKAHSGSYSKNVQYSFKYPDNLYMALNVRGDKSQTLYFFSDKAGYQNYRECVNLGDTPKEGESTPRDWELACDLENLLSNIIIYNTAEQLSDEIDPKYLKKYRNSKLQDWLVTTNDEVQTGAYSARILFAESVFDWRTISPTRIRVMIVWPTEEAFSKTQNLTGMDSLTLLLHIISNFDVSITY